MERIDVLATFKDDKVTPIAYKLNGKQYPVKEVTAYYSEYEGREKVVHIFVANKDDYVSELVYWPEKNSWAIKNNPAKAGFTHTY